MVDYDRALGWLTETGLVPTQLVSINPEGGPLDRLWFDGTTSFASWLRGANRDHDRGRRNLYFGLSQPKPGKSRRKCDMAEIRGFGVDIDGDKKRTMAQAWAAIGRVPLPPTFVIMTGGGYQAFWLMDEPLPVPPWTEKEPPPSIVSRAEALTKHLIAATSDDIEASDNVASIEHIFRLPHTINWPSPTKRARGRVPCPSGLVIGGSGRRYRIEELETALPPSGAAVIPFPIAPPGAPPAIAAARQSAMIAAAQAGMTDRQWFERLPTTDLKNECLETITRDPGFIPRAIAPGDQWRVDGWSMADAARLGANRAHELFLEWSRTAGPPMYTGDVDCEDVWRRFDPNRANIGHLIKVARELGIDLSRFRDAALGSSTTTTVVPTSGPVPMTAIPPRLMPDLALDVMNQTFCFAHSWGGEALIAQHRPDGASSRLTSNSFCGPWQTAMP